jgi:RNA polymerase sigma-70 factor (ECF subfamily)
MYAIGASRLHARLQNRLDAGFGATDIGNRDDVPMMSMAKFLMLLVEDDEDEARLTQQALTAANLVNPLRIVENADQAVDYLSGRDPYADRRAHPTPSLLLIDADLPDRGAAQLLDWLDRQPELRKIPTVLLTSASSELPPGCSASRVPKPVNLEGLLQMMRSIGMFWMILSKGPEETRAETSPAAPEWTSPLNAGGRPQDTDILGPRISFQKTSWELVRAARNAEALDGLIRMYWKPLYFFVRQKGYDNETAKDLVQDFLTAALEHGTLLKADPARGRFRTFLLAALTNFIKDWNRSAARLKRGGGHALLSLDFEGGEQEYSHETATEETPEALFHRAWARELLAQCISELKGKPSHLRAFELLMGGTSYEAICRETGLNESAAKTAIHRLRQQLRSLLLRTIGASAGDGDETERVLGEFASDLI